MASSASEPIRVGLIGHGQAGALLHAPLIEAAGAFRIVTVATSRTASLAARLDAPRQEPDPAAVIEAADVDLVVVATPNDSHHPLAAAALRAGKHVVVDKPFALSVAEADDLIALAARHQRVLTVFQNRRWDGDFLGVRAALASGELGELALFEARWDRFRPVAPDAWRNSVSAGAGVLWDLGPHLIDQALQLFGPPQTLHADVATQRIGALADDYFELTLGYGAMRCILSASSMVAAERPRFAAHGGRASLLVHGLDPTEAALKAGRRPGEPCFVASLPPIAATHVDATGRTPRNLPAGDWVDFYRALAEAIHHGGSPPVDPREAREIIAIIEQALRAAGR